MATDREVPDGERIYPELIGPITLGEIQALLTEHAELSFLDTIQLWPGLKCVLVSRKVDGNRMGLMYAQDQADAEMWVRADIWHVPPALRRESGQG